MHALPLHSHVRPTEAPLAKEMTDLAERLHTRSARVAVLGLGYAGLPMAVELAKAGFAVTGIDVDRERIRLINEGQSPVSNVDDAEISRLLLSGQFHASCESRLLSEADCTLICVPTPLTPNQEPDLRFVHEAAHSIAGHLHPGTLVVLQSTCAPGTTRKVLLPVLSRESGLVIGRDFCVAFAPERIDPGNARFTVRNTPKVVGGITSLCCDLAALLFAHIVERVVKVSSPEVAEMSKLVENAFRFINISFVNEMAVLCDRMGISIWEVVDAASTKPFAFLPHYPGPGVGGHCIPVVPFYLQSAAAEHGALSELIAASGRVNARMPLFVADKLQRLLLERDKRLENSRILVLGVAYKPDTGDTRESPALTVVHLLVQRGATVAYHDPYVECILSGGEVMMSLGVDEIAEQHFDCALLLTAHHGVDYQRIARHVDFILDTRSHLGRIEGTPVLRL